MKFLRNFPNAATRDAVLANVDYGVLSYTEGVGIKIKTEGGGSDTPAADEILFKYTNSEPFSLENTPGRVGEDINQNAVYAIEINEEKSDDTNIFVKLSGNLSRIEYLGATIPKWSLSDEIWFGPDAVSCSSGVLWSINREKVHTTNPNADIEAGWVIS